MRRARRLLVLRLLRGRVKLLLLRWLLRLLLLLLREWVVLLRLLRRGGACACKSGRRRVCAAQGRAICRRRIRLGELCRGRWGWWWHAEQGPVSTPGPTLTPISATVGKWIAISIDGSCANRVRATGAR